MMNYADFLARKQAYRWQHGPTINPDDVHPILHEWQRRIVVWAARTGRAAIFADCGLGKTFMQIEWARLVADRALIVAPLSVARQTVREAAKIDVDVRYARDPSDVGPGITITNYEIADRFDPDLFGAVVLDESSILKNVDGKTRRRLTDLYGRVPLRLACTATPAPNDVAELTNHAEFLGVMRRAEMLSAYFVNDDKNWRLKGHAADAMYRWMSSWAVALRKPSDLGYDDDGYVLPPLNIMQETVDVEVVPDGQLFATDLGGLGGRATVRRETLNARVARAVELVKATDDQWIVWCGMNAEAAAVASALPDSVNVQGSDDPDVKSQALEAFQDGRLRVLVTKPRIAGFGMNFQNAHRMAFVGLSDSYEAYYQAIRRCWRFGQREPVDVHVVVSELEGQIVSNVRRKEHEATKVVESLVKHVTGALDEVA